MRCRCPFLSPTRVSSLFSGRWLLFAGDSQIRLVFRRLTDSVSHLLTKESGPPTINGVVETNPAEYPFFGHKDFEVQWTEQTKKGPIVTRCASCDSMCYLGEQSPLQVTGVRLLQLFLSAICVVAASHGLVTGLTWFM
jgi:hypothetical protein